MWSQIARLASPAPRKVSTPQLRADEPTFIRLVDSLRTLLASPTETRSANVLQTAKLQLDQVLAILKVEAIAGEDGLLGPCMEYCLREGTFETLVSLVEKDELEGIRLVFITWFSRAMKELDDGFLAHSAVNKPLIKLLRACVDEAGRMSQQDELAVVETMCNVCQRIKTRPELLAVFLRHNPSPSRKDFSPSLAAAMNRHTALSKTTSDDSQRPTSPTFSQASASDVSTNISISNASSTFSRRQKSERDFLLYTYLLRFIHREGQVGDSARRGILSLCDVALGDPTGPNPSNVQLPRSSSSTTITPTSSLTSTSATREAVLAFAEYLLDSDFAEVVGAGLGALYGLLPSKLVIRSGAAESKSASAGEDSIVEQRATGMVLGGMGALGDEDNAEEMERKREEEDDRLRSMGVGISGTSEVTEAMDGFLKLVEFTQQVLKRCTVKVTGDEQDLPLAVDEVDDLRQRNLLLSTLTTSILAAVRDLFLQSVLYPSILECSETDGSAVAVMSYLDSLLEVIDEGTKLESAVLGFLLGEEDTALDRSKLSSSSSSASPRYVARVKRRKSSALLLIEQNAISSDRTYFTSFGRFNLRDLLLSHLNSSSESTATAALKLLQTVLVQHDRWSLALLDVVLDQGATSFPLAVRQPPSAEEEEDAEEASFVYRSGEGEESDDDDNDDFVYPSSDQSGRAHPFSSVSTLRPPATPSRETPLKSFKSPLGAALPSTPSVTLHLDSLDTLLSLLGSIDPSYRQSRFVGGASEMLSSAFSNYLRDAEASLVADRAFKRGVLGVDDLEEPPVPQGRRNTLFGTSTTLRGQDYAKASTGWRHKVEPTGEVIAAVTDSVSHFFSHSPDVNLALTAVISTLATCPYRSLEGWLLPVVRQQAKAGSDRFNDFIDRNPAQGSRSDDGDDRSVDFELNERSRHDALLSPFPRSVDYDPSQPPPSVTRAALAHSPCLLSILDGLVQSVDRYRGKISEFDKYLSERRQGLFFVENLADALHLDDLVNGEYVSPSTVTPPPALPVEPLPSRPSGLAAFFSPRRPSHSRSPSTPLNKSFAPAQAAATGPRGTQLRRSASNDSLVPPSIKKQDDPRPRGEGGGGGGGPASPFVAHYRKTGSIKVEPVIVASPLRRPQHRAGGLNIEEEEEGDETDVEDSFARDDQGTVGLDIPDSPSQRLSPLPTLTNRPTRSTTSASSIDMSPSNSTSSRPSRSRPVPTPRSAVSLSTILDNVIVLEEFIKELTAIVFVRRSIGIDVVRFV